jgi:hypothetical protein
MFRTVPGSPSRLLCFSLANWMPIHELRIAGCPEDGRPPGFGRPEGCLPGGKSVLFIDFIGAFLRHAVAAPVHQSGLGTAMKGSQYQKPMLRINTIETTSAITFELHGRLIGPWVPLLESLWRSSEDDPAGRPVAVDLTDVTAIDGAGRYLLRLMEAKSVTLAGGGIGIRALLDDEQTLVLSGNRSVSPSHGGRHAR